MWLKVQISQREKLNKKRLQPISYQLKQLTSPISPFMQEKNRKISKIKKKAKYKNYLILKVNFLDYCFFSLFFPQDEIELIRL